MEIEVNENQRLFARARTISVDVNENLFKSMSKKAISVECNAKQEFNERDKTWRTIHKLNPFTAGHGEWVENNSMVKAGIGTEIISKTGKKDENMALRV